MARDQEADAERPGIDQGLVPEEGQQGRARRVHCRVHGGFRLRRAWSDHRGQPAPPGVLPGEHRPGGRAAVWTGALRLQLLGAVHQGTADQEGVLQQQAIFTI
jgi:hypothetical protein